jgi:hypothetical protein
VSQDLGSQDFYYEGHKIHWVAVTEQSGRWAPSLDLERKKFPFLKHQLRG